MLELGRQTGFKCFLKRFSTKPVTSSTSTSTSRDTWSCRSFWVLGGLWCKSGGSSSFSLPGSAKSFSQLPSSFNFSCFCLLFYSLIPCKFIPCKKNKNKPHLSVTSIGFREREELNARVHSTVYIFQPAIASPQLYWYSIGSLVAAKKLDGHQVSENWKEPREGRQWRRYSQASTTSTAEYQQPRRYSQQRWGWTSHGGSPWGSYMAVSTVTNYCLGTSVSFPGQEHATGWA